MSTHRVTMERLTIHPHPNADALELAQVGHYRAVVQKGVYKTGDLAIYIPEQSVLPDELIEELGLTGRLAGKEKNRVKAIRLRGEVSQGIVCRPSIFPESCWDAPEDRQQAALEEDYAEVLGITKWVPPIPVHLAGKVIPAPTLVRWIDIENIKRFPDIFKEGEPVTASEKVHGSCCLVTADFHDGPFESPRVFVSSKGIGGQNLALEDDGRNVYWRAARQHNLIGFASFLAGYLHAERVGLFGEVYGKGVQDLHYGKDATADESIGYVLFDVAFQPRTGGPAIWLTQDEISSIYAMPCDSTAAAPPRAPVVYEGPYDYEKLAGLAEGRSLLDPDTIREGVVVRAVDERYSDVLGGRAIGKIVSNGYLLRGGDATEYE